MHANRDRQITNRIFHETLLRVAACESTRLRSMRYKGSRHEPGRIVLDRAGSGLERLVLIGHAGCVTLEALAWLRAIGAAFVQIGRDGEVLAHSAPYGYDGLPIGRAQALAVTNGLDLANRCFRSVSGKMPRT